MSWYKTAAQVAAGNLAHAREHARMSREDFMLALLDADMLDAAEAVAADSETPRRIKIRWQTAQNFRRMDPDLIEMATAMGLTDAQMDAVFGI